MTIRAADGPIDLVRYPYALLRKAAAGPGGFPTASLLDLATMKLSAIARRGIRRDFWDLDEIVVHGGISLPMAARAYVARFSVRQADLYAVVRALTFFDDAEAEVVWPAGLSNARWAAIKQRFIAAAPSLAASIARRIRGESRS